MRRVKVRARGSLPRECRPFDSGLCGCADDGTGDGEREGVVAYSVEHSVTGGSDEWWPRGTVELNFPQLLRERGRGSDDDVPATAKTDKPSQAVRFEAAEFDTAQLSALRVRHATRRSDAPLRRTAGHCALPAAVLVCAAL